MICSFQGHPMSMIKMNLIDLIQPYKYCEQTFGEDVQPLQVGQLPVQGDVFINTLKCSTPHPTTPITLKHHGATSVSDLLFKSTELPPDEAGRSILLSLGLPQHLQYAMCIHITLNLSF